MARKHRVPNNRISNVIGYPQSEANRKYNVPKTALNNYELDLQTGAIPPDTTFEQWRQLRRGVGVATAYKDVNDHLILNLTDGTVVDVGDVKGDAFTYEDFTPEQINGLVSSLQLDLTQLKPIANGALPTPSGSGITMKVVGGSAGSTWTHATLPSGSASLLKDQEGEFYWDATSWALTNVVDLPKTEVIDNLSTESPTGALSAKQGKILNDELNVGLTQETPDGYKSLAWNIPLSPEWKYYDSRCIINDVNRLTAINIVTNNSGSIKILAVGLDGSTLHEETKSAVTGLNVFNFLNTSSIENISFYVGVELVTGGAEMKSSTTIPSTGYEFWSEEYHVNWRTISYPFAYSIETKGDGIKGRIASLEIITKSQTTQIQQDLSKYGKISLDAKEFVIEETINIPSGASLDGVFGKSILKKGNSLSGDIINITNKEDVKISNIRLEGDLSAYAYDMNGITSGANIINSESEALANTYIGTNNGINIKSSERIVLDSIQFHKLNGTGLKVDEVGKNYIHGLKASKLFFYNCYKGIDAINEHEFSNYSDIMISLCQIGLDISSGNLNFANPIITRCRVGHILRDGFNNAHGVISGAEIKHHQIAGILIDNVSNGQLYNGLQMQYANLIIRNSKGIFIPDLFFTSASITCSGGSGKNIIDNLFTFGTPAINNTGNLIINNNINWNV